jgi:hypothetical protein
VPAEMGVELDKVGGDRLIFRLDAVAKSTRSA